MLATARPSCIVIEEVRMETPQFQTMQICNISGVEPVNPLKYGLELEIFCNGMFTVVVLSTKLVDGRVSLTALATMDNR